MPVLRQEEGRLWPGNDNGVVVFMRTKTYHREILVYRCPECGHEVEQQLMGTQHTSGLSCVPCETSLEPISLAESQYDYDEELVENDGSYTQEVGVPDGRDELERMLELESSKEDKSGGSK